MHALNLRETGIKKINKQIEKYHTIFFHFENAHYWEAFDVK